MMYGLLLGIVTIIIAYLGTVYLNSKGRRIKKVLNWVPTPPGFPLIGHSLKVQDSVAALNLLSETTKEFGLMFKVQFGFDHYLVISDYTYLDHVLNSTKILTKSVNYRFLHSWLGTGLLTSTGSKWKQRRRILTPAFHFSILGDFISVFDEQGRQLVEKLEKTVDKDHVDVYPYIRLCALDIICEATMGVSLNAQTSEDSTYVRSVKTMLKILIDRSFSATQIVDSIYPFTRNYREEKKALKVLHGKTLSVIEERRKNLDTRKSAVEDEFGNRKKLAFLDILLQATVDGKPLSTDDIREEVDTFMFEGHDTTTSGICFAMYAISQEPSSIQVPIANVITCQQDAIIEEQKTIYENNRDRLSTFEDLQNMKYLDLVLKEVFRLYPPVPIFGRRLEEDYEIEAGKVIPEGVNLIINAFETHRDPRMFPDPEKFDPSRWENMEGRSPYSYIPFSAGPRNCIGQKFAMLEIKSTISKLLRHFELLPAPSQYKPILQSEAVLNSQNGIHIKLKKRKWE